MNFNKEGYSTDEVAQILHCCKVTVMNLINTGELGANIYPKEKMPGKKRRIRITRKHIQEYMRSHQSKFSKEDLDAWKVFEEKPLPKPEIHEAYEASFPDSIKTEHSSFSINIDGRIAIGNIESTTASKIIDALLQDNNISYSEITIKKGVCYK